MSCSKSCLCQCEWPVDTHEPKLMNNLKDWLIFAVRLLSRMVVMKVKGQEAIWNKKYKPSWWDDEKYGEWKNPTTNGKDTIEVLLKKYEALENQLRKEGKFPTELEEEAKLLKVNKIEDLLSQRNITILYKANKGIMAQLKKFKPQFPPCAWDNITKQFSTVNNDEENGRNTDPESGSKLAILSSQSETQGAVSDSHCSPSQQQSSVSFNSGKLLRNSVSPSTGKQREAGIDVPSCSRTSLNAFNSLGTGSGCQDADISNVSLSSANHSVIVIPETSAASAPATSRSIPDKSNSLGTGRNCQTDSTPSIASLADLSSVSGTSTHLKRRKAQANVKGSKKARQQKFTPKSLKGASKTSEKAVFTTNMPAVSKGHSTAASDATSCTIATTYSVLSNKPTILLVTCKPSTVKRSEAGIDVPSCSRIASDAFDSLSTRSSSNCQTVDNCNDSLSSSVLDVSGCKNPDKDGQSANESAQLEISSASVPAISRIIPDKSNSVDSGRNYQTGSTTSLASLADLSSASGTSTNLKRRKAQTNVKGSNKALQQKFTPQSLHGTPKTLEVDVVTTNVPAVPKRHFTAALNAISYTTEITSPVTSNSANILSPSTVRAKEAGTGVNSHMSIPNSGNASDSVNRSKDCQTVNNSALPETFSASAPVVSRITLDRSNSVGTGNSNQTDSTSPLNLADVSSPSGTCPAKLDSSDSHTDSVFQNCTDSSEISMTNIPSDGRAVLDETDSCVRDNQNSDDSTILKDLAEVLSGSNTTPAGNDNVKAVSDSESPENYSTSDAGCIGTNPILNLNQLFTEEEQHEIFDQNDSILNIVKDFFLAQSSMDVTSDSENC